MAAPVDLQSASSVRKTVNLTSLFQARLAETPKKPVAEPQENLEEKEKIC